MSEVQNQSVQESGDVIAQMKKTIQQKDAELEQYKKRVLELEELAAQGEKLKILRAKETEEVDLLKTQSEDTLIKAKSIIFERTKVIKNQELQIDALNQQIESLKDVVSITKDLLEIRNLEVKQLESKIKCIEGKIRAEKDRHDLMHKKLETMIRHNGELKREYETQLCLFSALRERYSEKELAKDVIAANTNTVNGNVEVEEGGTSEQEPTQEQASQVSQPTQAPQEEIQEVKENQ